MSARAFGWVLGAAFAASVTHYLDNVVNYADYPQSEAGGLPSPTATAIGVSWFAFAAFAVLAIWCYRARRYAVAAACLAVYSVSGLIGIGHYVVPGALDMPWWRQAHVLVDIVLGAVVLVLAVRMATTLRRGLAVAER